MQQRDIDGREHRRAERDVARRIAPDRIDRGAEHGAAGERDRAETERTARPPRSRQVGQHRTDREQRGDDTVGEPHDDRLRLAENTGDRGGDEREHQPGDERRAREPLLDMRCARAQGGGIHRGRRGCRRGDIVAAAVRALPPRRRPRLHLLERHQPGDARAVAGTNDRRGDGGGHEPEEHDADDPPEHVARRRRSHAAVAQAREIEHQPFGAAGAGTTA